MVTEFLHKHKVGRFLAAVAGATLIMNAAGEAETKAKMHIVGVLFRGEEQL